MKTKRLLSLLLCAYIVLTMLSAVTLTANAAGTKAISLGTSGITVGNTVYFGQYTTGGTTYDVPWLVLDNSLIPTPESGTGLPLLSQYLLGTSAFQSGVISYYSGSTLQGNMDTNTSSLYNTMFATGEQNAMLPTTLAGSSIYSGESNLTGQHLFPLSYDEANSIGFGTDTLKAKYITAPTGIFGRWWLRSFNIPGRAYYVMGGASAGNPDHESLFVDRGVRPALNLNLNSVLFASAAADGKSSGAAGAGALTDVPANTPSAWKLTLKDSSKSFAITESSATEAAGGTVTLNYSGATVYNASTAPNEYISAMLVDANSNILFYGRLAQPASTGGTVNIAIPSGLAEGSYTLKVFSEQYNGDYKTDYASAFSDVALTVDNTASSISDVTPNGTGNPISGNIVITFSEPMNTTATGAVFLSDNGGATYGSALTGGVWSGSDTVYTIGYSNLAYGTSYIVKISGFKDKAGNTMADDSSHSFTTSAEPDTAAPTVSSSAPNGTGNPISGDVIITFSEAMYTTTAAGAVYLNGSSTALTGGSWSGSDSVYTMHYSGLSYGTTYAVTISGFKDAAGNTMTADSSHSFTTKVTTSSGGGGSSSAATYYTITATAGTGGSISSGRNASVACGNDNTYTITADDGYEIENVLVDGVSVGAVSIYTFENVKKAHTITASFKKTVVKTVNPFTDITTNEWFYEYVLYVYKNGLMTGTGADAFSPNGTMTRAMLVTVLYRLSGDKGSYTNSFSDVSSGTWYESAVAWAAKSGIASGVGGNRFTPESVVSREQLAVMLYNYAKYKGLDVSSGKDTKALPYNDAANISDYAYSALQWACGAGIMNGDGNGSLNPQSSATRAEVAAMLQRFIENVIG